ncbi:hypothetical protein M758_5G026300 [Ceratodon purpureus]|nr:hypothetical protein M758_5G026300 [Ceratodon purpureus]
MIHSKHMVHVSIYMYLNLETYWTKWPIKGKHNITKLDYTALSALPMPAKPPVHYETAECSSYDLCRWYSQGSDTTREVTSTSCILQASGAQVPLPCSISKR